MSCCHFRKYSPECISNFFLFPPHCSLWAPTNQPMSKATNLQDISDLCPGAAVGSQNWNVIHIIDVWGQFHNAAIEMGTFICSPHVRRSHSPSFLIRFSFPLFNHKSSILLIRFSSSDLPHPYVHPQSLYSLPTSHPRPTPLILFLVHPPSAPTPPKKKLQTLHIFVRFSVTRVLVFVQLGILNISLWKIHRASQRDRMMGRQIDMYAHKQIGENPQEQEVLLAVFLLFFCNLPVPD